MSKGTDNSLWWRKPIRVIQPNLQVRDTARIDPGKLVRQLKVLGANTIVFNVGGIYAWYPSQVRYHIRNEYLSEDRDLLQEVIDACREQELRFVARFDFGKAEDSVYLQRPEWFARQQDGKPNYIGVFRPGGWPLLLHTCINGGYRGNEVAVQVLQEVLDHYAVDGIFLNAPNYTTCYCHECKQKYAALYGEQLPDDVSRFAQDWAARCYHDNLSLLRAAIKSKNAEMPLILYYQLSREESILDRSPLADIMCTEPHDVLSRGRSSLPEWCNPALSVKLGRTMEGLPSPFGIIHTSPGMDWRHTGLPPAEHRFWMSQVPANGGHIWHSLTGIPDTIADKRILQSVAAINHAAAVIEPYMEDAKPLYELALVWNDDPSGEGWSDALMQKHFLFDLLIPGHISKARLSKYAAVIIPEGTSLSEHQVADLSGYAAGGGNLVLEGHHPDEWKEILRLQGSQLSEELAAAYIRLDGPANPLRRGLEDTSLIPLRGRVTYCRPGRNTQVLATLVPPFSPLESVGAPPERASLPAEKTDIPLAMLNPYGQGNIMYFPFSLGQLLRQYGLPDHHTLLSNTLIMLLKDKPVIEIQDAEGVQASVFQKHNDYLIHLVNGTGRRPLASCVQLHDVAVSFAVPFDREAKQVKKLLSAGDAEWRQEGNRVRIKVDLLNTWECIHVSTMEA
ncbi:family 10 glycosylhydrolase [Paenibacillus sepulcri]|uniref:Family 10 glycosylhydrolase n=1 Tax=Paenibacillus sepulcri TaxID=359917 RepID=A0ABS7BX23_9BACL|nr:family 10 glycosylhydrolase [Paenibacillus sepulcri]